MGTASSFSLKLNKHQYSSVIEIWLKILTSILLDSTSLFRDSTHLVLCSTPSRNPEPILHYTSPSRYLDDIGVNDVLALALFDPDACETPPTFKSSGSLTVETEEASSRVEKKCPVCRSPHMDKSQVLFRGLSIS